MYPYYQGTIDALTPMRLAAEMTLSMKGLFGALADTPVMRRGFAMADMIADTKVTHARPPYAIGTVLSGNSQVAVREEVVASLPFGDLLHFAKDDVEAPQPKMLVVAPLSGHFATLLRETVRTLSRDHDVYITDWKNARDVPLADGRFGFEDYVDYVIRFLEMLGPRSNVLSVCQPCVPVLAAVSVMAEDRNPAQPRTMVLMGGPVDVRVSPTTVNELAVSKPLDWFRDELISKVPPRYAGAGRKVYPGFIQLSAFMAMNMERHKKQHETMYEHLAAGRIAEAAKIRDFYHEYFAVLDLDADFYLETVDIVFQRALLAKGEMIHRGRLVKPSAIQRTALLTVEGERDDICAVGQTAAAHSLCSSLRPHMKRHHLQPGVGHYGVFSGRKWETQVYPQVRNMVLAMA